MLNESEMPMKKKRILIILGIILIAGIVAFLISPYAIN